MGGCGISDSRVLVVLRVFCGERGEEAAAEEEEKEEDGRVLSRA
jgi:hypothetical protein